jgi:hypothetical protein
MAKHTLFFYPFFYVKKEKDEIDNLLSVKPNFEPITHHINTKI